MELGMEHLDLGRLVAQETPGMPWEVPGEAAEPLQEPEAAAWEGKWYLHRALRWPWGQLQRGKAPVLSLIISRHF